MQPVCRGEVTRTPASGANAVGVLTDPADLVMDDLDAGLECGVKKCAVQYGPAHTAPGAALEFRVDVPPRFFAVWEEDERFLALLRAAMTSPLAAETLRRVFAEQVAPKLITATPDHPVQRIGLMGAFVIGLAITRYVLVNPPVAGLSREELSRWAAPVIKQLLVGPAPT
jgi:hypothetical protein